MLRVLLCLVLVAATSSSATNSSSVINTATIIAPQKGCNCKHDKIWLDIVLILDDSSSTTEIGFTALKYYFLSMFRRMSIGQGQEQVTRVGAIVYDDIARTIYNLDEFTSTQDLYERMEIPYYGLSGSNIDDAIRLAIKMFDGSGHRPNARKVIILATSHYKQGTYTDPTKTAQTFKDDGGVIVTFDYRQTSEKVHILEHLATSKCYTFQNEGLGLKMKNVLDVLCKANCFCKNHWTSYKEHTRCQTPQGGCFYAVDVASSEDLASNFCKKHMRGMLPKVADADKACFVSSLASNNPPIWIGLKWNGQKYVWEDGTDLGEYKPFESEDHSKQCVSQSVQGECQIKWNSADCIEEDYEYSCRTAPCSTDNFCALNELVSI